MVQLYFFEFHVRVESNLHRRKKKVTTIRYRPPAVSRIQKKVGGTMSRLSIVDALLFATFAMQTRSLGFSVVALCLLLLRYIGRRGGPYPPGPKGIPIVGNVLQIPKKDEWLGYKDWARQSSTFSSVPLLVISPYF